MQRRTFLASLSALTIPALLPHGAAAQAWLTIRNLTGVTVEVTWIDFQGSCRSYGTIAPGGGMEQQTYAGHVWALRDAATRVDFGNVVAHAGRQLVEVTRSGVMVR